MTQIKDDTTYLIGKKAEAVAEAVALALDWARATHDTKSQTLNKVNQKKLTEMFKVLLSAPTAQQDRLLASMSAVLGVSGNGSDETASELLGRLGSQSSPFPASL